MKIQPTKHLGTPGLAAGACLALFAFMPLRAGVLTNDFTSPPDASTSLRGAAKWVATGGVAGTGYISLTDALGSEEGVIVLPEIDQGPIAGFRADFKIRIGGGTARPGEGLAFVFAPEITDTSRFGEEGMGTGLVVSFDTYDNNGADTAPAIDVKIGGNADANIVSTTYLGGVREGDRARPGPIFTDPATGSEVSLGTGAEFVPVTIQVRNGLINLFYKGYHLVRDLAVSFPTTPTRGRFAIGARTGGTWDNHWMDDLRIETFGQGTPTVALNTTSTGFTVQLQDAPDSAVNASSVKIILDSTNLSGAATKTGSLTTFSYTAGTPFAEGSSHTVVLTYEHGSPPQSVTNTLSFIIPRFLVIPGSFAVAPGSVDPNQPGFKVRVHQIPVTRGPGDPNSIENAERQLAERYIDPLTGEPYANDASLSLAVNGIFTPEGIINWSQDAPLPVGNFSDDSIPTFLDEPIPGIPGLKGSRDNIAVEILTFLDLKAGAYRMGVNSDDGFRVTVGPNPRDLFSLVLGSFDTGRGSADTLFDFAVERDGVYPFRLAWWEDGGEANLEWFTVDGTGQKIPINDRSNPGAVKAYRAGNPGPVFLRAVSPAPANTNAPPDAVISIILGDGGTEVQPGSIKLFINGEAVPASVNKAPGSSESQVIYDPPQDFTFGEVVRVRLIYGDTALPPNLRTNDYSFQVGPKLLVAIDEKTLWRYENTGRDQGTIWKEKDFDDSAWPEGPALLAFEPDDDAVEPIRTDLVRQKADGSGNIVTDYFRTRFVFTGNPGQTKLRLRHVVDDGAVFYLNGVEIHRFGLPAEVPFNNGTLFDNHENTYEGPFDISGASLLAGTNVLAVQVHQPDLTSSDVVFGAELQLLIAANVADSRIDSINPTPWSTNVNANSAIEITLLAGAREILTNSIQLTVNGQPVSPLITHAPGSIATFVRYSRPGGFTPESVVAVKLTYRDSAIPAKVTLREYSFTIAPSVALLIPIDAQPRWHYENTGQDLGTAWKEKSFDDSAWTNGAALLAFETEGTVEPIRTALARQSAAGTPIITDYFRTHFTFLGDPAAARLRIRHVVDDGVVIYLNGAEVHRFALAPGLTLVNSTIFAAHENDYEGPFLIAAGSLVQGDNVLAAEVHQSDPTSSDVVFGLELQQITSTAPVPLPGPKFNTVRVTDNNLTIGWTGGGLLESAETVTGPWAVVVNATNPYSAPLTARAKFYRLRQ